jgi:hypothetical protein
MWWRNLAAPAATPASSEDSLKAEIARLSHELAYYKGFSDAAKLFARKGAK